MSKKRASRSFVVEETICDRGSSRESLLSLFRRREIAFAAVELAQVDVTVFVTAAIVRVEKARVVGKYETAKCFLWLSWSTASPRLRSPATE
jgi:hypothetical protein